MKRLMTELRKYDSDPNEALLELGLADEDVMHWRAVMKGVVGTAYEGTSTLPYCSTFTTDPKTHVHLTKSTLTPPRRPLAS